MPVAASIGTGALRDNVSIAPVIVAPVVAIGMLVLILFAPILGVQATELAKLVAEAESDLNAQLNGHVSTGAFAQLQPKFLVFSLLLLGWILISSTVTMKLAEGIASRRLRFLLAAVTAAALPLTLLIKYCEANWVDAGNRVHRANSMLDHALFEYLPAFEPGGLWLFTAALLIQTIVAWGLWAVYSANQPDPLPGSGIPYVLGGSIALFVFSSLLLRFAPPLTATWFGTINIIVLYVTLLYVFVAGIVHYLRTSLGFRLLSAATVYAIAVNIWGFVAPRAPSGMAKPVQAAATATVSRSEDQFQAWFRNRPKPTNPSHPTPVFLIASSGGGMRAAIRTVTFLDSMQTRCPDFLRHTFAISGVSGGALGALLYAAQQQLQPGDQVGCNLRDLPVEERGRLFRSAPVLDRFFATDVIPAIVGPGLFTEVFQRLLPPGLLPQFDRSVSFNNVLAQSWHDAVLDHKRRNQGARPAATGCEIENYLKSCDTNSYWDPAKNVPLLIFNATSATDGGLVPLSNVDLSYFNGLPLSRSIRVQEGAPSPFRFELLKAASASARFPIALPAATLEGADGRLHTLVDGAYFDNSGLLVVRAIKKRIESIIAESALSSPPDPINARVHIIYLRERETAKLTCETMSTLASEAASAGKSPRVSAPAEAQNADLAHFSAFLRSRDMRDLMNEYLINEIDKASIIDVAWDLHELPPVMQPTADGAAAAAGTNCENLREVSPLAFYYAPATRWRFKIFLESEILDPKNAPSLNQIESLLYPSGGR